MSSTFILSATRTPLGSFQGALASVSASRLGAAAIRGAIAKAEIDPSAITDVLLGNVLQAGQGQAPARQAALAAGLSPHARAVTISKVCGSGLQAVMQGAHAIAAGDAGMVVAGGMENMSASPYLLPKARDGYRLGHQQVVDSVVHDGLWDPYNNLHMGNCAEQCASKYSFTREQQDAFAVASYERANAAQKDGRFAEEITPVEITDAKSKVTRVELDEGPAKVNYDKLPTLRPSFDKAGTITPANASGLNDGAAVLVLSSDSVLGAHKPLARIVAFGGHAHDPLWFTTAPVQAARNALKKASWSVADVDLWEVNEAFAVVPMAFMRELDIPHDRLNIRGGAIALGHPIGASGARIIVTLLATLRERGLKRGVAALCIGGGEGMAVCIEAL
ncbi:MAG: thiolase family protein [Verrucomicrobia bacterium]|nr:thiolase family protein [Verrucomicrobiota bacterium]